MREVRENGLFKNVPFKVLTNYEVLVKMHIKVHPQEVLRLEIQKP